MISEALIEAAWRGEPEPVAQLITLTSEAEETAIRATDWPGGLTSGGDYYPHFPFRLSWAGAGRDEPFGKGRLTIQNVDRRIEAACEAATAPPSIDLALVRVAAPDAVEIAIQGAQIPNVTGDSSRVTADIRPRSFKEEPGCAFSYTPSAFPALF